MKKIRFIVSAMLRSLANKLYNFDKPFIIEERQGGMKKIGIGFNVSARDLLRHERVCGSKNEETAKEICINEYKQIIATHILTSVIEDNLINYVVEENPLRVYGYLCIKISDRKLNDYIRVSEKRANRITVNK